MEFTFDFLNVGAAGVSLFILVMGMTQFFKEIFNLEGNKVRVLSVGLGFLLMVLYQVRVFLPGIYEQIFNIVVMGLAAAFTSGGYYSLGKQYLSTPTGQG